MLLYMVRKQGEHLERNETKNAILEFILSYNNKESNDPGTSEPKIREYLQKKYGITDEGSIRKHLRELMDDKGEACLEKFPFKKRGQPNYWGITKIKHLRNIKKRFSEIKLNNYRSSLDITLKKFGLRKESQQYIYFIILLFLSASFFEMCIDTDIELIHSRALKVYRYKNPKSEQSIKRLLTECNTVIKSKLNLEISEERFREFMEKLAPRKKEMLEEYVWRTTKIYTDQAREAYRKQFTHFDPITEERDNILYNPKDFPVDHPELWVEIFYEQLKEGFPELPNIDIRTILKTPDEYQNMYLKIDETLSFISDQQDTFEATYLNLLAENFTERDIWDGIASDEEEEFGNNIKAIIEDYYRLRESRDYAGAVQKLASGEREIINKMLANHKDIFGDLIGHY